jgi:hypothetical protein
MNQNEKVLSEVKDLKDKILSLSQQQMKNKKEE